MRMRLILLLVIVVCVSVCCAGFPWIRENYETSTNAQVSEGASGAYRWGYHPIGEKSHKKPEGHRCPKCGQDITIINLGCGSPDGCDGCDITKHPDIDKYVLKSSIPPYPDMSQYALKKDMCPCDGRTDGCTNFSADKGDYMLKTDSPDYKFNPAKDIKKWLAGEKQKWIGSDNYATTEGNVKPYDSVWDVL